MVIIVFVAYFFYGLQPVQSVADTAGSSATSTTVHFKIVKGEGFREIAADLSRQTLIRSISVFKLYALLSGKAQRFQPGVYDLGPTMSVPEFVGLFSHGGKNEAAVTIPEGSTLRDVSDILSAAGALADGQSLVGYAPSKVAGLYPYLASSTSLEGFLFPDTYRFPIGGSADDAVQILLNGFNTKAWPLLQNQPQWYDTLILASYLEREVPSFADRQTVAGILLRRIQIGIPLQVDSTVIYAKCNGDIRNCPNPQLSRADMTIASPYNTYQHLGFTPTPIGNPGQSAIQAAATPRQTSYLYYLTASGTKETLFSQTLEQQNQNRAKYL